jgi:hypothetical protein
MSTWNHRVVDYDDRERRRTFVCHTGSFLQKTAVPTSHGEPSVVSENMEGLEWLVECIEMPKATHVETRRL